MWDVRLFPAYERFRAENAHFIEVLDAVEAELHQNGVTSAFDSFQTSERPTPWDGGVGLNYLDLDLHRTHAAPLLVIVCVLAPLVRVAIVDASTHDDAR